MPLGAAPTDRRIIHELLERGRPAGERVSLPSIMLVVFRSSLVNLYTQDIEAGLRIYRDLLGFEKTFRTPIEGIAEHVELRLDGFTARNEE